MTHAEEVWSTFEYYGIFRKNGARIWVKRHSAVIL